MKSLLLIIVLVFWQIGASDIPDKLVLTVYYESKCPDSRKYIKEQLLPAVNLLGQHLSVHLIPFGKARSIQNGFTQFECQHGPSECLGNMVQSCALRRMLGRPDVDAVSYVACEMTTLAGTTGKLQCVQQAHISPEAVNHCLSSSQGTVLQLQAEYLTNLIRPKFIPTSTVNGVFDQQFQDHSLVDLTSALCSILKDVKPCSSHYNHQALQYILL